jgi:DNA-binding response OmpR family regulator
MYILNYMGTNSTLLCIHCDPAPLSGLQESGYALMTAANDHEALRLFRSRPVDAILIAHHPGLSDSAGIAAEIKQFRPEVPIVLLADTLELPDVSFGSIDAIVTRSDGMHFLLATIHFVLNVKPARRMEGKHKSKLARDIRRPKVAGERIDDAAPLSERAEQVVDRGILPFSPGMWESIWDGTLQF